MPPVVFEKPEPRDDDPQRWWHIPISIKEPDNRIVAFFTRLKIVDCGARLILNRRGGEGFPLRWEMHDEIRGCDFVTLECHPTRSEDLIRQIPIVVRRTQQGSAFLNIQMNAGEARITEFNFIHGGIKTNEQLLQNNKSHEVILGLWSKEHRAFACHRKFILTVPGANDSNDKFTLE